jgi:uncharacterized membrane protein YoaK (UPF0700 family)
MSAMPVSRNAFLLFLAALAGWMDALGFSELGGVFTSFQSGNFIFLGLSVDEGDTERLVGAAVSLGAFLVGTALGSYAIGRVNVEWHERRLIPAFVAEWVLLAGFAVCWLALGTPSGDSAARLVLVALGAVAMGTQGAAVLALQIRGVVTNAMTATWMLAGVLVGLGARGHDAAREASPVPATFIVALCASYAVSALVVGAIDTPEVAAAVPAAALGLLLAFLAGPLRAHATGRARPPVELRPGD